MTAHTPVFSSGLFEHRNTLSETREHHSNDLINYFFMDKIYGSHNPFSLVKKNRQIVIAKNPSLGHQG